MSTDKTGKASSGANTIIVEQRVSPLAACQRQTLSDAAPEKQAFPDIVQGSALTEYTTSPSAAETVHLTGRQICLAVRDADADFGAALAAVGKVTAVMEFVAASDTVLEIADVRACLASVQREYNARAYCRTEVFGVRPAAEYVILRDKLRMALNYIEGGVRACTSRPLATDGSDPHPIATAYDEVCVALGDVNRNVSVAFDANAMPIVLDIATYVNTTIG